MEDGHNASANNQHDQHDGSGVFGQVAKIVPYFRKKRNVLLFKLDVMLLLWMFVAGVSNMHRKQSELILML
jgi:hypothetical protein